MGLATFKLATVLWCFNHVSGGYIQSSAGYPSYYPSYYPTFVKQHVIPAALLRPVASPVSVIQVQQKQPLQLRPPTRPSSVALPNTRPPVIAIHAQQQQQQQNQIQAISAPASNQGIPVVAIQSQQQQRPNIPASPVPSQPIPVSAIQTQQQIQTIPVSSAIPQQFLPVAAFKVPARKIVLPAPTAVPNYSFGYAVNDPTTGDQKSHEETRTGDNVVGRYSVVEPDGTLRTVTYTAGINGFNAVVERTPGFAPPNAPPRVVAVSKPVAIASPVSIAVKPATSVPVYPAGFHFGG